MAQPRLMIMIGLPSSGKTRISHDYIEHIPLSRRQFDNEAQLLAEIERLLRDGQQVVEDDQNLTRAERLPLIETALSCGVAVEGYVMLTSVAECLELN
jgi:predicted kinase